MSFYIMATCAPSPLFPQAAYVDPYNDIKTVRTCLRSIDRPNSRFYDNRHWDQTLSIPALWWLRLSLTIESIHSTSNTRKLVTQPIYTITLQTLGNSLPCYYIMSRFLYFRPRPEDLESKTFLFVRSSKQTQVYEARECMSQQIFYERRDKNCGASLVSMDLQPKAPFIRATMINLFNILDRHFFDGLNIQAMGSEESPVMLSCLDLEPIPSHSHYLPSRLHLAAHATRLRQHHHSNNHPVQSSRNISTLSHQETENNSPSTSLII